MTTIATAISFFASTLKLIKGFARTKAGADAIVWVNKHNPELGNLIKQGLNVNDGILLALELNNQVETYSIDGRTLTNDEKRLKKIEKQYNNAVHTYNRIKSQLGRKRGKQSISKARRTFLLNELSQAKTNRDFLKKLYDSQQKLIGESSYNLILLAVGIVVKYKKLDKVVN